MQAEAVLSMTTGVDPQVTAPQQECRGNVTSSCDSSVSHTVASKKAAKGGETAAKLELSLSRLERRRKSNCLSARRWRNRKRSKFTDLQDQISDLRTQQAQMELENAKLKKELAIELELAKAESASRAVKSRGHLQERTLRIASLQSSNAQLHPTSNWTAQKYPNLTAPQEFAYHPSLTGIARSSLMAYHGSYSCEDHGGSSMMHAPAPTSLSSLATTMNSRAPTTTMMNFMAPPPSGHSRYFVSDVLRTALMSTSSAENQPSLF